MWLTRFCIQRPIIVAMLFIALLPAQEEQANYVKEEGGGSPRPDVAAPDIKEAPADLKTSSAGLARDEALQARDCTVGGWKRLWGRGGGPPR